MNRQTAVLNQRASARKRTNGESYPRMSFQELHTALEPIVSRFVTDTALLPDTAEHHAAHGAKIFLTFFMHALDAAKAGQPALVELMTRRLGFNLSVHELVRGTC